MTPEEHTALERRRRAKNIAILLALIAMVVLFYFVSVARMTRA